MRHNLAHTLGQNANNIAHELRRKVTAGQHAKEVIRMLDAVLISAKSSQIGTKAEPCTAYFAT